MDPAASLPHVTLTVAREYAALCENPLDRTCRAAFESSPAYRDIAEAARARRTLSTVRRPDPSALRAHDARETALIRSEALRRLSAALEQPPSFFRF